MQADAGVGEVAGPARVASGATAVGPPPHLREYLSWVMMGKGATRLSPVLRIPFTWVYLATVLCFAIMSINAILRLVGIVPEPEAHGPGEEVL